MFNLATLKGTLGQKATTVADYLAYTYPNECISTHQFKEGHDNIMLSQNPLFVKTNFDLFYNTIYFLRPHYINFSLNNATNGFSVFNTKYKNDSHYKYFIPMMYNFKLYNKPKLDETVYGFYETEYRQNKDLFFNFIKENNKKIKNVHLLGGATMYFKIKNKFKDINIKIFKNKFKFFESITHFVFPMSDKFVDPWPTTLEEAVRCNKQIIILNNTKRKHKDGIDDIMSCIKYHSNINDTILDNSDSIINKFDNDKYYRYIFNCKFRPEYKCDYKTFEEFLIATDTGTSC